MTAPLVIAIDGPAAAGKSTVAQMLAQRLRLAYVDSGATYRAAALKVLRAKISPQDEPAVARLIRETDMQVVMQRGEPHVLLDGEDVSEKIRTSDVALAAAQVSRLPEVRAKLVEIQRTFARGRGVVMEGRDIGTVVFPEAPLKIFLQADPEERARRRLEQDRKQGRASTLDQTRGEITRRDQLDEKRKISPLVAAPDACVIDSTHLTAEQVVERILEIARQRNLVAEGSKQ
jgi:CMP/dCMP kinase